MVVLYYCIKVLRTLLMSGLVLGRNLRTGLFLFGG